MAPRIEIATNLRASVLNKEAFSVEGALERIHRQTNNYEVVPPVHRFYLDVDGKKLDGLTEAEFWERDAETLACLRRELENYGTDARFLTASSWLHRIISYRVYFQDRHGTTASNKAVAEHFKKTWVLPEGISVDTAPYGSTNQKLRMLGSHKDGENRPLRKVDPNDEDDCFFVTLISEGSHEVKEPAKPKKTASRTKAKAPSSLIAEILASLAPHRAEDYDTWLKIGMACKTEGEPLETWVEFSRASPKFDLRACETKWETFQRNEITIGTLWKMLEEDAPAKADALKNGDYERQKKILEEDEKIFKLMRPFCFVCAKGDGFPEMFSREALRGKYENVMLRDGTPFIDRWLKDPAMRTYERMEFLPSGNAPPEVFNTFRGWAVPSVPGDTSAVHRLLDLVANHDPAVREYLLNYHAWLFQKPEEKTEVMISYASDKHGIGKDTWCNFILSLFGRYGLNITDPSTQLFDKFVPHLAMALYVKVEELSFTDSKKHKEGFKFLATRKEGMYQQKGTAQFSSKCFLNLSATTNNETAIILEAGERRNVILEPSAERKGDFAFWKELYDDLGKPEVRSAFLHELLTRDISGFHPVRDRPFTEAYRKVIRAQAPFHASYFQYRIQAEMTWGDGGIAGHELASSINDYIRKYIPNLGERKSQAIGRALEEYVEQGAITKVRRNYGFLYTLDVEKIHAFLVQKGWWEDV